MDFGAGGQTGMGAGAVHHLRQAIFGQSDFRVKVTEPYQMLGEIDEELRRALDLDVIGIATPTTMFGFACNGWKPFTMNDGTPVLVPEKFNATHNEKGDVLMYPEGDTAVAPCAVMPKHSYFFERYFGLVEASAKGWANSCALLGCLVGALLSGALSDRFGRKRRVHRRFVVRVDGLALDIRTHGIALAAVFRRHALRAGKPSLQVQQT